MENSKRECDMKVQCRFCPKMIVKRWLPQHIQNKHVNDPNYEAKCHIINCLDKHDDFFAKYFYVKDKVNNYFRYFLKSKYNK